MSTLAVLLEALAAARRAGEDFDAAWEAASASALGSSCDPGDWAPVLASTRDAWSAAYNGWPASSAERGLSLLAFDAELADVGTVVPVTTDDRESRVCRRCSAPIPPERGSRAPALYCSARCRRAWHSARARERVAV